MKLRKYYFVNGEIKREDYIITKTTKKGYYICNDFLVPYNWLNKPMDMRYFYTVGEPSVDIIDKFSNIVAEKIKKLEDEIRDLRRSDEIWSDKVSDLLYDK